MPYSNYFFENTGGGLKMYKPFIAAAAAALVLATGLAFAAPEVTAGIPSAPGPALANAAAACPQHAWPDYEPRCLFDTTRSAGDDHKVRVIIMDGRKTQ
jgi:hypothetical protein